MVLVRLAALPGITQVTSVRLVGDMTAHPSRYGLDHAPRFDSWGLHLYGRPADYRHVPSATKQGNSFSMADLGRVVAELDAAFPHRRVRFHISETGWMTPGGYFGDEMTAEARRRGVVGSSRAAAVHAAAIDVVWFSSGPCRRHLATHHVWTTGLRYPGGLKKPSYGAWRNNVASGAPFAGRVHAERCRAAGRRDRCVVTRVQMASRADAAVEAAVDGAFGDLHPRDGDACPATIAPARRDPG